jgi:hypothetical protein
MTHAASRAIRLLVVALALLAVAATGTPAGAQQEPNPVSFLILQAQLLKLQSEVNELKEVRGDRASQEQIKRLTERMGQLERDLRDLRASLPGDWRDRVRGLEEGLTKERRERQRGDEGLASRDDVGQALAPFRDLPKDIAGLRDRLAELEPLVDTLRDQIAELSAPPPGEPLPLVAFEPTIDIVPLEPFVREFNRSVVPPVEIGDVPPPENDFIPFLFTLAIAGSLVGANAWQQHRTAVRARIATQIVSAGEESQSVSVNERDQGPRHVVCFQFVGATQDTASVEIKQSSIDALPQERPA